MPEETIKEDESSCLSKVSWLEDEKFSTEVFSIPSVPYLNYSHVLLWQKANKNEAAGSWVVSAPWIDVVCGIWRYRENMEPAYHITISSSLEFELLG